MVFYVFFNIIYVFLVYLIGIYFDRFGKKRMIMVGFVVVVLVFLVFVYVRDLVILVGVFVFYGFYIVIEDIVLRVYMVDLVKDYEKGIIIDVFNVMY